LSVVVEENRDPAGAEEFTIAAQADLPPHDRVFFIPEELAGHGSLSFQSLQAEEVQPDSPRLGHLLPVSVERRKRPGRAPAAWGDGCGGRVGYCRTWRKPVIWPSPARRRGSRPAVRRRS